MSIISLLLNKKKSLLEKRLVNFLQTLPYNFAKPDQVCFDDLIYVLTELIPANKEVIKKLIIIIESLRCLTGEGEYAQVTFLYALKNKLMILNQKFLSLTDEISFHEHMPNLFKDEKQITYLKSLEIVVNKFTKIQDFAIYIETTMLEAELKTRLENFSSKSQAPEKRVLNVVICNIRNYKNNLINLDKLIHSTTANYQLVRHSISGNVAGFFGKQTNVTADLLWNYLECIKVVSQANTFIKKPSLPRIRIYY